MILDVSLVADLCAAIGAAALEPQRWQDFVELLHRVTGGVIVHAHGHDALTGTTLAIRGAGYDPEHLRSYEQYYANLNPYVPGFMAVGAGRVLSTDEMIRRKDIRRTEFYNDWLRPQENAVAGGGVVLFQESSRAFALGGSIPERYGDRLEAQWLRLLELLTPHLQQAFEINRALAGARIETFAASQTGDALNTAVIALSDDGRILYANPLGRRMLETGNVIRADLAGRIAFGNLSRGDQIARALHAMRDEAISAPMSFILGESGSTTRYACRTIKISPDLLALSRGSLLLGDDEPCLVLTLTSLREARRAAPTLKRRFGLTQAEAEVALDIAEGCTPRDVAKTRAKSIHTVRAQIKAAMSKMSVRRQADMVREIERLRRKIWPVRTEQSD